MICDDDAARVVGKEKLPYWQELQLVESVHFHRQNFRREFKDSYAQ